MTTGRSPIPPAIIPAQVEHLWAELRRLTAERDAWKAIALSLGAKIERLKRALDGPESEGPDERDVDPPQAGRQASA